jgi:hypothetical protein
VRPGLRSCGLALLQQAPHSAKCRPPAHAHAAHSHSTISTGVALGKGSSGAVRLGSSVRTRPPWRSQQHGALCSAAPARRAPGAISHLDSMQQQRRRRQQQQLIAPTAAARAFLMARWEHQLLLLQLILVLPVVRYTRGTTSHGALSTAGASGHLLRTSVMEHPGCAGRST